MDERMQFVARRLAGEAMADLCREFGIYRKTGYKIFDRYQKCGIQGLSDRRRRPYRSWRSGGFGSALASNASSPAIRSKTAVMNACISP
jgi:hypothetical protein